VCAFRPDPPATIQTENIQDKVKVTWAAASGNGYPLLEYKLHFKGKDGQLHELTGDKCDGNSQLVITGLTCSVSLATLSTAPFDLVQDDSVIASLKALTDYGESDMSVEANGAKIWLVPDAPISLQDNPSVTDDTKIMITWSANPNDGSTPVIDYLIHFDQGQGNYIELEQNIVATQYTTTIGMTAGTVYSFKVKARNLVGLSDFSLPVSILAARVPDPVVNLVDNVAQATAY
jgi:hypothetical protein